MTKEEVWFSIQIPQIFKLGLLQILQMELPQLSHPLAINILRSIKEAIYTEISSNLAIILKSNIIYIKIPILGITS